MVTTTLRKNLGPPILKQKHDSCIQEDQEPHSTSTFLSPVKLMLTISNFFLHLVGITLYQKIKFHSLIPLKRNSSFMRYLFISRVNGLKTFYIDIKTIEHIKKQTVSKKDGRFQR